MSRIVIAVEGGFIRELMFAENLSPNEVHIFDFDCTGDDVLTVIEQEELVYSGYSEERYNNLVKRAKKIEEVTKQMGA